MDNTKSNQNPAQGEIDPTEKLDAVENTKPTTPSFNAVAAALSEPKHGDVPYREGSPELSDEEKANNSGLDIAAFATIYHNDITPSFHQYSGEQDVLNTGFFNSLCGALKLYDNIMVTRLIRGIPQVTWVTVTDITPTADNTGSVVTVRLAGNGIV